MSRHAYQYKQALRWMERLLVILELALVAAIVGAIITHHVAFIASAGAVLALCLFVAWVCPVAPTLSYTEKHGQVVLNPSSYRDLQKAVQRIYGIQQFFSSCYLQEPIQRGSEAIAIPELIEQQVYAGAQAAYLCCPLSGRLIQDPVYIGNNGLVVDRLSVEAWLAISPINPLTRDVIMLEDLPRAPLMSEQIQRYIQRIQDVVLDGDEAVGVDLQMIFCPISGEPISEPIRLIAADRVVDKASLRGKQYCPFSNQPLDDSSYEADKKAQEVIDSYVRGNGHSLDEYRWEAVQPDQEPAGAQPQDTEESSIDLEAEYRALCCPLSGELMVNPITLGTGKDAVVDHDFILECMEISRVCPLTGQLLDHSKFQEHTPTKERLARFKRHHDFSRICGDMAEAQYDKLEKSLECSISMERMTDPVSLKTAYPQDPIDRSTVEQLLDNGQACPFTRNRLPFIAASLYPRHAPSVVKLRKLQAHPNHCSRSSTRASMC
jgi:hypothetical protein